MDNKIFQLIMGLDHKEQQDCKPILFINLCVNRRTAFAINAYKLTLQHSEREENSDILSFPGQCTLISSLGHSVLNEHSLEGLPPVTVMSVKILFTY